jgi:hypothetical protein
LPNFTPKLTGRRLYVPSYQVCVDCQQNDSKQNISERPHSRVLSPPAIEHHPVCDDDVVEAHKVDLDEEPDNGSRREKRRRSSDGGRGTGLERGIADG